MALSFCHKAINQWVCRRQINADIGQVLEDTNEPLKQLIRYWIIIYYYITIIFPASNLVFVCKTCHLAYISLEVLTRCIWSGVTRQELKRDFKSRQIESSTLSCIDSRAITMAFWENKYDIIITKSIVSNKYKWPTSYVWSRPSVLSLNMNSIPHKLVRDESAALPTRGGIVQPQ